MKLNPDCIRAILLAVEEETDFKHNMLYNPPEHINVNLLPFTHDEIIYHINQCSKSQLIADAKFYDIGAYITIRDLTPVGHEFLANIRNKTLWSIIKSKGSTSLPILMELAKLIATEHFIK